MKKIYIVMYHYTRDLKHSRYPGIKGLDVNLFREQILFLKSHFHIVDMERVIDAVRNGTELPERACLLTFDDGYIDNYTYALPVLEEARVQGSFFVSAKTFATHQLLDVNKIHYVLASADIKKLLEDVCQKMDFYRGTEFAFPSNAELMNEYAKANRFDSAETIFVKRMLQTVLPEKLRNKISSELFEKYVGVSEEQLAYELYMSEDQIRTMKRHGMYIGVHGYDHYWLGNLTEEELQQDINKALEVMDGFIDKKCWVMNYPYGNYTERVVEFVRENGACVGLTIEPGVADLIKNSALELPRFDCNDFPPKSKNYVEYI